MISEHIVQAFIQKNSLIQQGQFEDFVSKLEMFLMLAL